MSLVFDLVMVAMWGYVMGNLHTTLLAIEL